MANSIKEAFPLSLILDLDCALSPDPALTFNPIQGWTGPTAIITRWDPPCDDTRTGLR